MYLKTCSLFFKESSGLVLLWLLLWLTIYLLPFVSKEYSSKKVKRKWYPWLAGWYFSGSGFSVMVAPLQEASYYLCQKLARYLFENIFQRK